MVHETQCGLPSLAWTTASLAALKTAMPFPPLPEFYSVGEFITRRVLQAVTGEMPVKDALDAAAGETTDFLKGHGYYQ